MTRTATLRTALTIAILACGGGAQAQTAQEATPAPSILAEDEMRHVERLFTEVDVDGNGRISRSEMGAYGLKNNLGTAVRQKSWKRFDADKSGWISREEFAAEAVAYRERQLASKK